MLSAGRDTRRRRVTASTPAGESTRTRGRSAAGPGGRGGEAGRGRRGDGRRGGGELAELLSPIPPASAGGYRWRHPRSRALGIIRATAHRPENGPRQPFPVMLFSPFSQQALG